MGVVDCPVCGAKVNALVPHCPECGADPRLPREAAEADLRARGITLPGAEPQLGGPAAGAAPSRQTALQRLLSPPSVAAGPAAWPAVIGAALFIAWGLEALPLWLALALLLVYPLFVHTAEHRRCRELAVDVDGGLQLLLGIAAGVMWMVLPAALSESLFDATVIFYRQLSGGAMLQLILVAGVFVPLLFGLVFRYLELRAGSWWALALVTAAYVTVSIVAEQGVTPFGVAWTAFAALVYALAYLATRRLWLPIGLRAGAALLVTDAPVFSLDLVKVARPDLVGPDATLHLALLGVAALVLLAIALRRGSFVGRRGAWHAQTGRHLAPPAPEGWTASAAPRAGLWAAFGCAALLDGVYWFTGGPWFWLAPAVPLTYWAYVHFVERRTCVELGGGPARAAAAIVAGAASGFVLSVLSWLPSTGPFAEGGFLAPDALTAELLLAVLFWALCEEVIWRGLPAAVARDPAGEWARTRRLRGGVRRVALAVGVLRPDRPHRGRHAVRGALPADAARLAVDRCPRRLEPRPVGVDGAGDVVVGDVPAHPDAGDPRDHRDAAPRTPARAARAAAPWRSRRGRGGRRATAAATGRPRGAGQPAPSQTSVEPPPLPLPPTVLEPRPLPPPPPHPGATTAQPPPETRPPMAPPSAAAPEGQTS